ncbi:MAG: hypothetical protein K0U18_05525 [Betaproteobacteria bacterium]|nr:hypothetical protein [Betaproteobacteria bacterium]MCH9849326.1 hypothetical protein [Betaproteobacteria bacterium]
MVQTGANKPLLAGKERLQQLVPLSTLSPASLDALAEVLTIEKISRGIDPTKMRAHQTEALYLISGDLGVRYQDGKKLILRGETAAANNPINTVRLGIKDTIALTPIEIIRIDLDVLNVTQTWDQMVVLTNRMHKLLKQVLLRAAVEQR